jgi:hypothetical protein
MGYKKIAEISRSERTVWSPERGGRKWQIIGKSRVKKFAFSPYTAKAQQRYTFYADIEMEIEIESPPKSGKKRKNFTVIAFVGTFLEFRDDLLSGEGLQRLVDIVESVGGGSIVDVSYWRNRGEREYPEAGALEE